MQSQYSKSTANENTVAADSVKQRFANYTQENCSPQNDKMSYPTLLEGATIGIEERSMSAHITRDEFDSKLSAVEARMDARIEKFSSDMKQVVSELRIERADRDTKIATATAEVSGKLEPLKSLKVHMWAGVIAVAGVIVAAIALSTSSFDSGRNMAKDAQEIRQEFMQKQSDTDQMLSEIRQSLKSLADNLKKNSTESE